MLPAFHQKDYNFILILKSMKKIILIVVIIYIICYIYICAVKISEIMDDMLSRNILLLTRGFLNAR